MYRQKIARAKAVESSASESDRSSSSSFDSDSGINEDIVFYKKLQRMSLDEVRSYVKSAGRFYADQGKKRPTGWSRLNKQDMIEYILTNIAPEDRGKFKVIKETRQRKMSFKKSPSTYMRYCPEGMIYNPFTGRCLQENSRRAKFVKKYRSRIQSQQPRT